MTLARYRKQPNCAKRLGLRQSLPLCGAVKPLFAHKQALISFD
jgi:hypothetical protein